jgi:outer membrane protein TolC
VADLDYFTRRNDTSGVQSGFLSSQSADVSISLSQTLFSDSEFANYKIQSLLLQASGEKHRQTQLDTVLAAGLGMADVLQARAEAAIQRENLSFTEQNLSLAIDRVKLGASSSADQYRWETQVANAKSSVFGAFTRYITAQQSLNRILNLPINDLIELGSLDIGSLNLFSVTEFFDLLDNADTFQKVYDFGTEVAFEQSPEIKQIESLIAAKQRELTTLGRRRWLPELSLTGQVSENLDQTRAQTTNQGEQDWVVMLNARIPFYQGGQLSAQRDKAALELAQLGNQMAQTKLQIGQQLRANMNATLTALFNLEFTETAAAAAKRSLTLVSDAYSKGAMPIVDLLDAQNTSVNANLAKVQASIGYFRSSIETQRVIGEFHFMLSQQQKDNTQVLFKNSLSKK